jgi:hypothetical protein
MTLRSTMRWRAALWYWALPDGRSVRLRLKAELGSVGQPERIVLPDFALVVVVEVGEINPLDFSVIFDDACC